MTQIDWQKERQRLSELYASMESAELQEIAAQSQSLTEVAKDALRSEMLRRAMPGFQEKINSRTEVRKPNSPKPVIIRRFLGLQEATLAKCLLDSAGIESFLTDDNIVRLDWFYSNMVGGIKLLVRDEDAETANELLEQNEPENLEIEKFEE